MMKRKRVWADRYRDYEQRCVEADKLPDELERQEAFSLLTAEWSRLRDSPDAPPPAAEATPLDEIIAALCMNAVTDRAEHLDWWAWIGSGCNGDPPPSENAKLRRLVERLQWHRSRISKLGALSPRTYSPSALASELGFDSTATLNKLAKGAGVTTPRRGQRNYQYPAADIVAICAYLQSSSAEKRIRAKAKQLAEMLAKIER